MRLIRKGKFVALPRLWLLSDTLRLPDPLPLIAHLPKGAGVILRHYGAADREELARNLAQACRERGLVLLVAGDAGLALRAGALGAAIGVHWPEGLANRARGMRRRYGIRLPLITMAAHGRKGLVTASRLGLDAVFLSPVFPTRSHPGAKTLGGLRFAALARSVCLPVMALGGVTPGRARQLAQYGAAGVAGIDLFTTQRKGTKQQVSRK